MNLYQITDKEKKYLISLWHQLDPWSDSSNGISKLNKNFITASLSNGNIKLQKDLIKYACLNFDFIFSAEHFKKYKPHKEVYLGAVKMLNLKIDQCTLVAAHKNDLSAAAKLGMNTIYINREAEYGKYKNLFKEENFKADLEVFSLIELLKKISY